MPLEQEVQLERFLAGIYADAKACAAFVADPEGEARRAGLPEAIVARLLQVDRVGLELAGESFARKRARKANHTHQLGLWRRLLSFLGRSGL
jgi:hypothetical protein